MRRDPRYFDSVLSNNAYGNQKNKQFGGAQNTNVTQSVEKVAGFKDGLRIAGDQ